MYKNVVVAIDLETNWHHVIDKAINIAKMSDAKLNVVYVSQMVVIDSAYDLGSGNVITPGDCEINKQRMQEIVNHIEQAGINASGELVKGINVVNTLVEDVYQKYNYDLLICGSNNKTEFAEMFLGSVSQKLADKAKTDVFIVKH